MSAKLTQKKKLGDILVESGLISATQLQQGLVYGKEHSLKLGDALQGLGFINENSIARTLAKQLDILFIDFTRVVVDPETARIIPEMVARKHKVIALGRRPGEILVAFADPLNIFVTDEISRYINNEKLVICTGVASLISAAVDQVYNMQKPREPVAKGEDESAAVAAVNEMILQAVLSGASDLHLEPTDTKVRVRLRVDGLLRQVKEFPLEMHAPLVSRIKIISQLDIGERRKPQDGRCEIPVSGRDIDIRVSVLPLNKGEKVVMRLLDKSKVKIDLSVLGFEAAQLAQFEQHIARPHEIVLVTGPTGSGKTTTLYAALHRINSVDRNVITVEDPVEYELAGVNQVQVNRKADLTFANALRAILRQDPDVIMIGEIRDPETAEIAIQSALTGHLVLSTLHTNDAAGAIARLTDMEIPPFLIATAVGMVVAQRLVRRLCPDCREAFTPPETVQKEMGLVYDARLIIYRPKGCPRCDGNGFKGRLAVHETLSVSPAIEELIMSRASSHDIFRQAEREGMISLRRAGIAKVLAGHTSLDEVLRVTLDAVD
ncbi:MAG: hypothetical protein A2512_01970 [Deltaproteobacteria bacterium RIFOXYD12_FULL_56_24]|nr:MAG: hypothetical protein A2512_01970 [Deltaproteobacteria bacterium RIFOXYD12_FULL_56_24]